MESDQSDVRLSLGELGRSCLNILCIVVNLKKQFQMSDSIVFF